MAEHNGQKMFLKNNYAIPLFDHNTGGPPRAFQCCVTVDYENKELHNILGRSGTYICGKITRTEVGMRMHLKRKHNWKEQPCLFSTEESEKQLLSVPVFLKSKTYRNEPTSAEQAMKVNRNQQRFPEMSEQDLLLPTKKEK
jgi:hypothetical protein